MEKNQIINYNREGYWEIYWNPGEIWHKGNYINGERVGLWEFYYSDGESMFKEFFVK
jgi:antitoxin component YwqK of YwqJK toxin-antitoxin module